MSVSKGTQPELDLVRELLTIMFSDAIPEVEADGLRLTVEQNPLDHDEIEMDSGADVFSITVGFEGITVHGRRKMGDGRVPYADKPTTHKSLLEHPTLADTEGTVVYPKGSGGEDGLRLPKTLYFEESRMFGECDDASSPVETPEDLVEAVNAVLDIRISYEKTESE
ncbi:hypothetical protein [Halorhabdus rudnickae]|uniref:hypothetical protein n=1 Tax=Halorhabdus rudnickae TaxID=1775544 RepID=UPI0010835588|nr:hypothetical protein [Halorhabdus rudnickae]